jgi:hypothetical protein
LLLKKQSPLAAREPAASRNKSGSQNAKRIVSEPPIRKYAREEGTKIKSIHHAITAAP